MYKPRGQITGIQQGQNVQGEGAKKPGANKPGGESARHRGRISKGANKTGGERAKGRTSQGANQPGGEQARGKLAKGRKSQTPCGFLRCPAVFSHTLFAIITRLITCNIQFPTALTLSKTYNLILPPKVKPERYKRYKHLTKHAIFTRRMDL